VAHETDFTHSSSVLNMCLACRSYSQFGHIVLTTTYGIMDHEEARRRHTGGKLLGFFY
jgi:ribosomal protein S8